MKQESKTLLLRIPYISFAENEVQEIRGDDACVKLCPIFTICRCEKLRISTVTRVSIDSFELGKTPKAAFLKSRAVYYYYLFRNIRDNP